MKNESEFASKRTFIITFPVGSAPGRSEVRGMRLFVKKPIIGLVLKTPPFRTMYPDISSKDVV